MNGTTARTQQDARYLAAARKHGAMIERLARGYEADRELRRDLVMLEAMGGGFTWGASLVRI